MSLVATSVDVGRQLATVAGASSFFLLGSTGEHGDDEDYDSPVVPASEAFAIWGPIFLANLAMLVVQTGPAERRDPLLRSIAVPLAVARGAAGIWPRVVQRRELPLTLAVVGASWGGAALAYRQLPDATEATPRDRWLVNLPVGLLFGWLTVAAVASKTEGLLDAQAVDGVGADLLPALLREPTNLAVAAIAGTAVLASTLTLTHDRSLAFPAAVAWGLGGIVARQLDARPVVAAAAAGALFGLGFATAMTLARRRNKRVRQAPAR